MAEFNFILRDLFPQLFRSGRGPNQPDQRPRVVGVGHVYTGDEPPMMWVQREQQRVAAPAEDAAVAANQCRERGNSAFRAGNYQEAMTQYTEAIELDPNNELNYSNRSLLNNKLGEFNAAAQDAQMAININPDFYKAHYRLGQAFVGLRQYQYALNAFQAALERCPADAKEEIQKEIAKCESRLARTPLVKEPQQQGSGGGGDADGGFGAATPPRTPNSTAPGTGNNGAGAGALVPTNLARDAFPPATITGTSANDEVNHVYEQLELDLDDGDKLTATLGSIRTARNRLMNMRDAERLVSTAEMCFCTQKEARIKHLFADSDPEKISRLAQEASAAQDKLREAVSATDRAIYTDALRERDAAYNKLWETTHRAVDAVEELLTMARQEQQATGHVDELRQVYAIANLDKSTVRPLDPSEVPGAIEEYRRLNRELHPHVARLVAKVRADFLALQQSVSTLQSAIDGAGPKFTRCEEIAQQLALAIHAPPQSSFTAQRVDALQALQPRLKRLLSDEATFKQSASEGNIMLQREAELERERLRLERTRIQLQAELEWLAVKEDDDPNKQRRIRQSLETCQCDIRAVLQEQDNVQKRIVTLIGTDHPELAWNSAVGGKRIMKWVKGSGLWVNSTFSDFTIVSTLASTGNSKVYHVRNRRGVEKALKEIPMESEKVRKRFQNEVNIMTSVASHPNVLKVEGVFFDGPFAYMLMPLFRRGSLKKVAVEAPLPMWKIQEVFRQIVSGVAYLHEHGVVHSDLKPSNILISDDFKAIVSDFGVAKDVGRFGEKDFTQTVTSTGGGGGGAAGTADFMAPEQLIEGKSATTRSDIWSLGVTMFSVASVSVALQRGEQPPPLPVLVPPAERIGIDVEVVGNERLVDLLSLLLVADPTKRLSAPEVLAHPFLSVSLVEDLVNNRQLVESNGKLEAFRTYLHALRSGHRQPVLISVVRNQMVESVASVFQQLDEGALLRPVFVVFRGEDGVDEGALTTEMFHLYFQQAVSKHHILVTSSPGGGSDSDEGGGANTRVSFVYGAEYTLSDDSRIPLQTFTTFGRVLLKCIIENRPLPLQLNASVLKFLLGVEPSLHDLEEFDRSLTQNLRRLLLLSPEDLAALELNFDEFPDSVAGEHAGEAVTAQNVQSYVMMRVKNELVVKRQKQLDAMKMGFETSSALQPHLQLLNATELQMLLCGQQHIDAALVLNSLEFVNFPPSSQTPANLRDLIASFSQNNLRRFLRLCTASVAIPVNGLPRKIKVLCCSDVTRLPVGHSCAFQLDLPDYTDKETLRDKLATSLAHCNEGFFIA